MRDIAQFLTDLIIQGYLGLFIACFVINMLPFGPSNMVLAGIAQLLLPFMNWLEIGVIVAVAATLAKIIHYYIVRSSRLILSEENIAKLDREHRRVEKWGPFAMFFSAASPFPDDPIIVYVAFTKYNVVKAFLSYFSGKVIVTIAGAIIGGAFSELFDSVPLLIGSIALTLLITAYLFTRESGQSELTTRLKESQEP
ncbi:MAG: hypothetical protein ACFFED_09295 [Candidatus Thorarchaeota archaeon]